MRVVGLVPARGGSKGIPRKNARLLAGRPLLAYTAEAASRSRLLSRVILTTEDPELAELGRACGLEVPFLRPADLARDETPMLPVVEHALRWLEAQGDAVDAVCLLQPTHPLRRSEDIDACIELCDRTEADAVVTIMAVPPEFNPHWVYFRSETGELCLATGETAPISRRQDLPPAFCREGSVYVIRRDVVIRQGSLYGPRLLGVPVDRARSVNLDTMEDWSRAEAILGALAAPAASQA
jgi:CMP-N,N'-diacetyllegionaminic acid synthase